MYGGEKKDEIKGMAEKVAKNYEDAKTIAKQKQLENEKNNDKDK